MLRSPRNLIIIMEHTPEDGTLEIDLICIEAYGITYDFFNEVLCDAHGFIERCKNGFVKTYTQRFQNCPQILEKSDPIKVATIDKLIKEAIEAGEQNDIEAVNIKLQKIRMFRQ